MGEYGERAVKGQTVYQMGHLIPFGEAKVKVQVPSVFSHGELIERSLTIKELMEAYDMELSLQSQLIGLWEKEDCSPLFAFTRQVPLKCL